MSEKTNNTNINIDTQRLSRLARLDIDDSEMQTVARELKKMADYTYPRLIAEDSPLPFSYCASTATPREDVALRIPDAEREAILDASPTARDGYITVPRVISEGGEDK